MDRERLELCYPGWKDDSRAASRLGYRGHSFVAELIKHLKLVIFLMYTLHVSTQTQK